MNKSKVEIQETILDIKKQASSLGVILDLDEDLFKPYRQDAIWYGGYIGGIKYDKYKLFIEVHGEVRATLLKNDDVVAEVIDKNNEGKFYEIMKDFIPDDSTLSKYMNYEDEEYSLVFSNNNWLEYCILDTETNEYINDATDILSDNDILKAFENLQELIDIIKYWI